MVAAIERSVVTRLSDSVTGVTIPPNGTELCRKYASCTHFSGDEVQCCGGAAERGSGQDSLVERLGRAERCEGCRWYSWKLLRFCASVEGDKNKTKEYWAKVSVS